MENTRARGPTQCMESQCDFCSIDVSFKCGPPSPAQPSPARAQLPQQGCAATPNTNAVPYSPGQTSGTEWQKTHTAPVPGVAIRVVKADPLRLTGGPL